MAMINAIVLDDEWYNLEEICTLAEKTGFIRIAGKYQNPLTALQELSVTNPQAAFIDIEMPEMDGITFAEKLLEHNPSIIIAFITSWNQYAVQAFDLNALDYVMKPIREDRFNRMAERIRSRIIQSGQKRPAGLKIQCFGSLEVHIGNAPVKWERAKAEELFAYLLLHHDSFVHKDVIIENLWSEHAYEKALPILQTSVCKIRSILSPVSDEVTLDYGANKYCLSVKNARCDYIEVEQALAAYNPSSPSTFAAAEHACTLYGSGLLTQQGYLWGAQRDESLHKRLLHIMKDIGEKYLGENNQKSAARYLLHAAELAPYDDDLNYRLLELLLQMGENREALAHYRKLETVMRDQYDLKPSARLASLISK